jgi:Holliday junction resolvase
MILTFLLMGNNYMINSRTKGAAAEREIFKILSDCLGVKVERNLVQTREGGADTVVGDWAIEVKRQETLSVAVWWVQAVDQAKRVNKKPMLIYRKSRMPWRVIVTAQDFIALYGGTVIFDELIEVSLSLGIRLLSDPHMTQDPQGWQAKVIL